MDESKLIELINDKKIVDVLESKNHLALAKLLGKELCGFTKDDEKYVDLFWDAAFNKSWIYVSDEIVINWMGYKKSKNTITNFVNEMKGKYKNDIDYKEVSSNHELVVNYNGSCLNKSKKPAHNKKHYIITGEALKKMLLRAGTKNGDITCDYFIKVESLVNITSQAIFKFLELENQKQLAEKDKLLLESKEQLEHQKRGVEQIKSFITHSKLRTKMQRLYIVFSRLDATFNIFKVGGCQSANLLKSRLSTYNTSQSSDNLYTFAAIWECHDYMDVESRIKQIIGEFRQKNKKEVYMMHYTCLFTIIDFICNHYNEESEEINNFIRNIIKNMTELKPIIPEPIKLDRYEIVEIKNGEEVKRDEIILDKMTIAEQEKTIKDLLTKFRKPDQNRIKRTDFEEYIVSQGITDFKKRPVWAHLKKIVGSIAGLTLSY